MRAYLRNLAGALSLGLSVLAVGLFTALPIYAQVEPTTATTTRHAVPRQLPLQVTHYIRTTFAFNSCTQASNACTVRLTNATLPYNAVVLRVIAAVYTAFNSTSTDVITLGTTSASHNEIVSSSCNIHAIGVVSCTLVAASLNSIGNTAAQTAANGGFDLYMNWTGGGGTPSAGLMSLIVEYIPANDGLCTSVALGAAPAGC